MEIGGGYVVLESSISSIFWLPPFNHGWLKVLLNSLRQIPGGLARSEKIRWAEVSRADPYKQHSLNSLALKTSPFFLRNPECRMEHPMAFLP